MRRKATYIHKLEAIFNAIDESQDGLIDEDELNELFMDSRVTTYLETLEILGDTFFAKGCEGLALTV